MTTKRILAALAGAALAGLAWATPASASTEGKTILLLGDSIMQSISGEVRPQLEAQGWTVVMQYMGGTGLTSLTAAQLLGGDAADFDWQEALAGQEARYDPDVVVIFLGTNDVNSVSLGEPYTPHIDRMLSSTDAPRVLWSECSTALGDPVRDAACPTMAGELAATVERRPGFSVVPYAASVTGTPDALEVDGIHLTQSGQDVVSGLVSSLVGAAPVPVVDEPPVDDVPPAPK